VRALGVATLVLALGLAAPPADGHHVGVFIPRDDDVTTNVKQIRYAAEAGRWDLALRLFDDGIVHATMEKREKELPHGLEDGLRAALRGRDGPGAELRLAIVLGFLTRERLADARQRLRASGGSPERRRDQARKLLNAAWRYYNLADFVVSARDARAGVAVRMGFEDAQTFLGGMMVDPMWAGAASARPAAPDEVRAIAVIDDTARVLGRFITDAAAVARAGGAHRFLPRR
jgi:hypothetical protein